MTKNRILIIDDEEDIATLIAKVAEPIGYEVVTTGDAGRFRTVHRDWQPTHVVLDLHMPGTDGIELIRFLAAEKSVAQIVIMSGFDSKVLESARLLGAERGLAIASSLAKPIRVAHLRQVLLDLKNVEDIIDDAALRQALEQRQLFLAFQPKIAMREMQASHVESLVRWRHPTRGDLPPSEFIPLAERAGLITDLTREVVRLSLTQLRTWRANGMDMMVSINVSGKDLSDLTFADDLLGLCRSFGVDPNWVTLELTETAAAANAADAMDILTRLRLMGFRLSIDDFGTGYSSLKQLHRLPFSELKIDKEFVTDCPRSEENRVIVLTIVALAHNLGMSVVAEGAEDKFAVDELRYLGCDFVQGFYFSRPLPGDRMEPWIAQWPGRARDLLSGEQP